jgi:hypothetical protein
MNSGLNGPTLADSKSLKIWTRVVVDAPLCELILDHQNGFDLVKVLLEKLWQDCTISYYRQY